MITYCLLEVDLEIREGSDFFGEFSEIQDRVR